MSLRVLHAIATLSPKSGGPQTAIWPMLDALQKHGVSVELASTDADGPGQTLTPHRLPAAHFPVHMLPGESKFAAWVDEHVARFDVVHVHGIWNRPSSAAMSAARIHCKPYVVRSCGMLAPYSWNRRWWKKRPYWWLVERKNVRNAAAIHVTSPGERDEVAEWGMPPSIREIPLGLDATAFETPVNRDELRRRCGPKTGDRPIVLTMGRLHPVKAIAELLLPAFARQKSDAILAIAGGQDDTVRDYPEEIRRCIDRLGLNDRVVMLGAIEPRDKWAMYDGARLYIQSSRTENFGLSVAEALGRGCPVIVTEGVQSRSVVEAVRGGWVVPFDRDRLAAAIDEALASPAATRELGEKAAIAVKAELSWDRGAERLKDLYQSLVTAKK